MIGLKECAFCRHEASIMEGAFNRTPTKSPWFPFSHLREAYRIYCMNLSCGVSALWYPSIEQAIAAWNKRAGEQERAMFELNGCPFCGGEVMVQESTWDKEPQAYTIECSTPKCPIDFCWFDTKEQAIEAWNDLLQGVHDEHQQAVIKVAVKAIDGIHCEADGMLSIKGQYCHHNGCTTVEVCGLCMIEHLKPHLKALKGLIDG